MCKSRNTGKILLHDHSIKVDKCLQRILNFINLESDYITLASCCGHGKYPMTIVIKHFKRDSKFELFTGSYISRKRKFYRKDSEGFYYIPEVDKLLIGINEVK